MKASMVISVRDLIQSKYGVATWKQVMQEANIPETTIFMAVGDVKDTEYYALVNAAATVLGHTRKEMWDAVAEHWVGVYTQKVYSQHYKGFDNVRDFLGHMNDVHKMVTRASQNATPPSFSIEYPDASSMVIGYESKRDMFEYFTSLIGAVTRHFKESVTIHKIGDRKLRLVFN